jgi:hypothetical protein
MLRYAQGRNRTAFGMNAPNPIYLELVDFVAAGSTPREVADFHPSPEAQARVAELVEREKESQLTPEEASELAHFLELEHILRMAKARARLFLANEA